MPTKLEELWTRLDELQSKLGRLGFGILGEDALRIPTLLDEVGPLLSDLESSGANLLAEQTTLVEIREQLRAKAPVWLKEVGGPQVLLDARQSRSPQPEQWWWFLDESLQAQQKRRLLRGLTVGGIILVMLIVAFFLVRLWANQNSTRGTVIGAGLDAEDQIRNGDLETALQTLEKGLAADPQDVDLLVFKGALLQIMDQDDAAHQEDAAQESFRLARAASASEEDFLLARSRRYLFMGLFESAYEDAQAMLEQDRSSAVGYMLMGQALDGLGRTSEALDAYDKSYDLAMESNQPEIAVAARMLYGQLLQQVPVINAQATPTVSPVP